MKSPKYVLYFEQKKKEACGSSDHSLPLIYIPDRNSFLFKSIKKEEQ
jgi:hypothetical protein